MAEIGRDKVEVEGVRKWAGFEDRKWVVEELQPSYRRHFHMSVSVCVCVCVCVCVFVFVSVNDRACFLCFNQSICSKMLVKMLSLISINVVENVL